MRLTLGWAAALTLVTGAIAGADLATACTCSDQDERDRLESGEVGVLGKVLARRPPAGDPSVLESYAYRLRVERSVGARLGREVTIVAPQDGCGPGPLEIGQPMAALLQGKPGRWKTNGCSIADHQEFRRALRPYPPARGRGRVALLAGGSFGSARVMALDQRGRILGYGFGEGEVRNISVCPGSLLAAELVAVPGASTVAIRDLRTLEIIRESRLPRRADQLEPGQTNVHCDDSAALSVHAGFGDYVRREERVHVYRAATPRAEKIATEPGYGVVLVEGVALLESAKGLFSLSLSTGTRRQLSGARVPDVLAVSPDERRIAVYARNRLRIIDLVSGEERSRRARYGDAAVWLSPSQLLFRAGGEARVYDLELDLLRRYSFFRSYGQALVGGKAFGTDRFQLRALVLRNGKRRRVRNLPDRGIIELQGVAGGPLARARRRAPRLGYEVFRPLVRGNVGGLVNSMTRGRLTW